MKYLTKVLEAVVVIFLAAMTGLVILQAAMRFLLGQSLFWSLELTRYLMVWTAFLGASLALKENGHIKIEVFVNRLKGRFRLWVELISNTVFMSFLIVLLILSSMALPDQLNQTAQSMPIKMFWFYLAIPVGAFFMILFLSLDLYKLAWCVIKSITHPDHKLGYKYPECKEWLGKNNTANKQKSIDDKKVNIGNTGDKGG